MKNYPIRKLWKKFYSSIQCIWRDYLLPWWQDNKWIVVELIVIFTIWCGYVGFKKYYNSLGEYVSNRDIFYSIMQLFVLDAGDVRGRVSWELDLARYLAAAIAFYTVLEVLGVVMRGQLQLFQVKHIKNHVIICGLGQKGLLITRRFCERGDKVMVIELDEENDMVDQCREHGAFIVIGDAAQEEILRKAHVHTAKYLIAVCGNDGINAEIAVTARSLIEKKRKKVLTCIIHIVNQQLCHLLKERELELGKADIFRLEFFNIYDHGARSWLNCYPAINEKSIAEGINPHVLIVGLGQMGESLVMQFAKIWRFLIKNAEKPLRISLVDKEADKKLESLNLRYPKLRKTCELISHQMDFDSIEYERASFLFDKKGSTDITDIYVCLDEDSQALSAALVLHERLKGRNINISVKMMRDAGLATLLKGESNREDTFINLNAFGLLDKTCNPELLLAGTYEMLARAIHEDYIRQQKAEGKTPQVNPSMVPWEQLPEDLKESNRRQADHIGAKLATVRCALEPLTDWETELFKFTSEEIEVLAKMEHERWCLERKMEGWTFHDGPKNIDKKTSPYLVPWEKLQESIKEENREIVRDLPSLLAKIDFQIYRQK